MQNLLGVKVAESLVDGARPGFWLGDGGEGADPVLHGGAATQVAGVLEEMIYMYRKRFVIQKHE